MKNRDADLRAEIESHLEMAIADRIARGATPEEVTMIHDTLVQERLLAALSGGFGALAALLTV